MEKRHVTEFDYIYKGFRIIGQFLASGWRVGYVQIPKELQDWAEKQDHHDYAADFCLYDAMIDCHGGITFVGEMERLGDGFFIGFDCAHFEDANDYETLKRYFPEAYEHNRLMEIFNNPGSTVRDTEFVQGECKHIVDQLVDIMQEIHTS